MGTKKRLRNYMIFKLPQSITEISGEMLKTLPFGMWVGVILSNGMCDFNNILKNGSGDFCYIAVRKFIIFGVSQLPVFSYRHIRVIRLYNYYFSSKILFYSHPTFEVFLLRKKYYAQKFCLGT